MTIQVSAPVQSIQVSVSGSSVAASVSPNSQVSAVVSGGMGPRGEPGQSSALSSAPDVDFDNLSDGDVLRYSSAKWRNHPETSLVDGGNF